MTLIAANTGSVRENQNAGAVMSAIMDFISQPVGYIIMQVLVFAIYAVVVWVNIRKPD